MQIPNIPRRHLKSNFYPKFVLIFTLCISYLHSLLNNREESIIDYRYLTRKKPKNFSYVIDFACAYARWNGINSALSLIDNFYKNKKKYGDYYDALGLIFKTSKNY